MIIEHFFYIVHKQHSIILLIYRYLPTEPSAPGEDILARDQNGNLAAFSKDNNLTSYSIPNVNNNSTPPPVEQPDRQEL